MIETIAVINTKKVLSIILLPVINIKHYIKTTQATWDIKPYLKKRKPSSSHYDGREF